MTCRNREKVMKPPAVCHKHIPCVACGEERGANSIPCPEPTRTDGCQDAKCCKSSFLLGFIINSSGCDPRSREIAPDHIFAMHWRTRFVVKNTKAEQQAAEVGGAERQVMAPFCLQFLGQCGL